MKLFTLCIVTVMLILGVFNISYAQIFNVTTPQEFQQALSTTQSNGEDDTINVAAGTYNISTTLKYTATEDKKLTIQGAINNTTTLDGLLSTQIMNIDTTKPSSDSSSVVTVKNIVFINGKYTVGNGGGLCINTTAANIDVENSSFINNIASGNGGGLYARSNIHGAAAGSIYIKNNYIYGNTAHDGGGAYVHNDAAYSNATVLLVNNVVVNNISSNNGGGIHAAVFTYGSLYCNNNTILNNSSTISGGGFYFDVRASSSGKIYNNIVWNNISINGKDIYIFDYGTINLFNNDYGDFTIAKGNNFTKTNNISSNPELNETYHLNYNSPCINTGNNSAQQLPSADKDGNTRIINGVIDMGAYEYKSGSSPIISSFSIPSTSTSLTVTILSFVASDAIGVTGYLITETSVVPSIYDTRWTKSPQQTYVFDNPGSKVIYVWVKNSTGYVSSPQIASVTITLLNPVLTLTIYGNGSVNSIPSGFSCTSAVCSSVFANGSSITLQAAPSADYIFSGWSGDCTGIGNCSLIFNNDTNVTSTFTYISPVKLINTGNLYTSLQVAYDSISNTINTGILTRMTTINEDVIFNKDYDIKLSGGYDVNYTNSVGMTNLVGSLIISKGKLSINNLIIRKQ